MTSWLREVQQAARHREPCVLVTVASTRGSTPREIGAKMVVTEHSAAGSIGGGQLEYQCIQLARQQLRDGRQPALRSKTFPLGADCGQCCGGVAEVLFEPIDNSETWVGELANLIDGERAAVMATLTHGSSSSNKLLITDRGDQGVCADELTAKIVRIGERLLQRNGPPEKRTVSVAGNVKVPVLFEPVRPCDFNVTVFGAGHVGSATIRVLGELPCRVRWIDSRAELVQQIPVPDNVEAIVSSKPDSEVANAPSGSYFLVMTHSHPLDQAICARILGRGDFAYCGLIGSRSKKRRFDKRLRALGFPEGALAAITCPIGAGISGKKPGQIAVAAAAELLQLYEQNLLRVAETRGGRSARESGVPGGR